MKNFQTFGLILLAGLCASCKPDSSSEPKNYSGIYPSLAMYNNEGECGTGAVVPWNDKLYVVTYGPHLPLGSSDKLYIIDAQKNATIYPHSVGGTPANRMIHPESNTLFIGPYVVDRYDSITVVDPKIMPGRHTGMARHLTDPTNKVYYATMEEGFYEYDIATRQVTELYTDVNLKSESYLSKLPDRINQKQNFADLFGVHGKGAYSGQGVLVYSNNGEAGEEALEQYDIPSGSLSEWDGVDWKLVRRNQFVEVTGPGGIYGNKELNDPLWATGWDHKSVILGVRDADEGWSFFRLPKTSRSYDGAHGWNTEWPRIREIGKGEDLLMTMHGMFWTFPKGFSAHQTAGIRPRSAYLKVIGDFAEWGNQIVFGCDDAAQKEFLNKRKIKGNLEGAGQSNSNLWFVNEPQLDHFGPVTAEGAVWINEEVSTDNRVSEPFLFSGWNKRNIWLKNHGDRSATFVVEVDQRGDNRWSAYKQVDVPAGGSYHELIRTDYRGEWVRVKALSDGVYSALFSYHGPRIAESDERLFDGIATVKDEEYLGGYVYALGNDQRKLGMIAGRIKGEEFRPSGYYELNEQMELQPRENTADSEIIEQHYTIEKDLVRVDEHSVLVIDDLGRRWRFPKGDNKYDGLTTGGLTRLAREVVTERDLMNLHGTFYELPAENADGFAKVRPVATHNLSLHDFASYRGLLVLSGIAIEGSQEHIVRSKDGNAAVWVGAIDDLWKLGKPKGFGGPLYHTAVERGTYSDPYLFGFYDQKRLRISHDNDQAVRFNIQLDPSGNGEWLDYKTVLVESGDEVALQFPDGFEARWIRFATDRDCKATTLLNYD